MTRVIALFLSALLIAGCSSRPDRIPLDATVAVSPDFDDTASESVITALSNWEAATGHRFAPTLRIGDYEGAPLYIKPGALDGTTLGDTLSNPNDTAVITIDVDKANRVGWDLLQVSEHELGHAFGLEHEEGTIMCAHCNWAAGIDATTLSRFEENYR